MLSEEELREIDHFLLDLLDEGRVTPAYASYRVIEDGLRESITNQYCQQRLGRLVEHGYARNLSDSGLYELKNDPRGGSS